jgi:hypothetical protein
MDTVQLNLTIDDINKVLAGLGQQPYLHVYELINKIQNQVTEQLNGKQNKQG